MEVLKVSVDKLTFLGGIASEIAVRDLNLHPMIAQLGQSPFVKYQSRAEQPYKYSWHMQDGSILQMAEHAAKVPPLRYEFNPNHWDGSYFMDKDLMMVLRWIKNPRITRLDVAIDIIGEDLSQYDVIDLRSRKQGEWRDRSGKRETLYIGSPRAPDRLRIYNKAKEREEKDLKAEHEVWWRVEAQLRGDDAENYKKTNPFRDLKFTRTMTKSNIDGMEYDIQTKAMIYYFSNFPDEINKLNKNYRSKWRQMVAATSEETLTQTFYEIYEDNLHIVESTVRDYLHLTTKTLFMDGDET